MRERLLKEEDGFTLPELMVTMMMMILVMFALYSIFDMSIRVFSFGNDKVEAVENARIGLERMEREIRAAYPYDRTATPPDTRLLATWSESEITFGHDLNRDHAITSGEEITYNLSGGSSPTLLRNGQPVIEFVEPEGLKFEYLRADETAAASEAQIAIVRVELTIVVDDGVQKLSTDVALRNRSSQS